MYIYKTKKKKELLVMRRIGLKIWSEFVHNGLILPLRSANESNEVCTVRNQRETKYN